MSEPVVTHYRCLCPNCRKVLKIRVEWSGKKGMCPHCRQAVEFPVFKSGAGASATTQQLLRMIAPEDNAAFDGSRLDRLALLLAQATCRDYQLAQELLAEGGNGGSSGSGGGVGGAGGGGAGELSPRQWRRTLNAADLREAMRLRLSDRMNEPDQAPEEPDALLAASDNAAPNAWKVLARFLYFQRHGMCDKCQTNPTGLECMYLSFEQFAAARDIPEARVEHWRKLLHHHLGL